MIQLSPGMRVFLHVEPIDFRNGIDGLAGACRRRTSLKILVYDGQGFWLCQKRLSEGTFKFWPRDDATFSAPQIQVLLYNGNPSGSQMAPAWKPLPGTI